MPSAPAADESRRRPQPADGVPAPGAAPSPAPRAATVLPTLDESVRAVGGGLTTLGVTVLLVVLAGAGALADALTAQKLVWGFAVLFSVACLWTALRVRPRDRRTALVAPPLVYALIIAIAVTAAGGRQPLRQWAFDVALLLADRAPVLVTGLVLAAAALLWRRRRR